MAELLPPAVCLLCFATCVICLWLLMRGYARSRVRLLLWSALCFAGLALNNLLLFLDMVVFPTVDLTLWRHGTALAAMLVLLFGLIWES